MVPISAARRVAIYARFSSDKQSDSSIEDQVHRARALIDARGGDSAAAQVFSDYATSGASMQRPGMQALLAAIDRGDVELVIAESLDRISRDVGDADRFRKLLQHRRAQLLCLDGTQVAKGKGDALLFGVRSLFAEAYLSDLGDKTLRGLEGRARAGKATGGAPYGYRLVRGTDGSTIEIDREKAATVRRIFAMYAQGHSLARIASQLNAEGVPAPRAHVRRTCTGWMDTAIRAMLLNERYRGAWAFGAREWVRAPGSSKRVPRPRDGGPLLTVQRPDLAIVDAATWDTVQARFAPRAGSMAKTARVHHPLSGVLRCGVCGGLMTCVGGKVRRYGCALARKRDTCSNRMSLRVESAEKAFFAETARQLLGAMPDVLDVTAQAIAEWSRRKFADSTQVERQLRELEREAANIAGAIAHAGALPALVDQLAAIEQRRAAAGKTRAALLEPAPVLPHPETIAKRVASIEGLRHADADVIRQFARTALEGGRIDCTPGVNGYTLHWAISAWSVIGENPGSAGLPGYAVSVAGAGFAGSVPLWVPCSVAVGA